MAKYGPSGVVVTITDAPGGGVQTITPYVTSIGGVGTESITQQTNPFGVTTESHTPVGLTKVADIAISGFFDDTATSGVKAVFFVPANWALDIAPASVGRVLTITVAALMIFTITVHLIKAEIGLKKDGLTEYTATVRQKTAGVWTVA